MILPELHQIVMSHDEIGGWYVHGHLTKQKMREKIGAERYPATEDVAAVKIRRVWMRSVPSQTHPLLYDRELMITRPKARGAFKATVAMLGENTLRGG